jgi:hypothetical protein
MTKQKYYSAKLVKRLILSSNKSLEKLFSPARGAKPKLVHITPLYTTEEGKIRTLTYVSRVGSGVYHFYLGAVEEELDMYAAISTLESTPEKIEFNRAVYHVRRVEVKVENLEERIAEVMSAIQRAKKVKVVLASPTVLRDPLVSSKHKTLVPSVFNLFSTPIYIKLYLSGRLRRRTLIKTLLRLHRALTVPPTFWQTLRKIDLQYEPGRKVPALIGYLNLHYNPENDPDNTALDTLRKTLPYMLALGTGVGRAAGLGHTTIHTPRTHADGRG